MTLGQLIAELKRHDPARRLALGLDDPHSYRGDYSQLGFEPKADTTVGQMLKAAEGALGRTFDGYKGGKYRMDEYTNVYIAHWGECGEQIGPILLAYMLGVTPEPRP